ncbi:MAG: hypothetical protein P4L91_13730 [Burkholderiaceae bacterium]|nr:hypothetical protein [Burkholderiaceae bacterium]
MLIMKIIKLLLLGILSILIGCSSVPPDSSRLTNRLVGCWYGEDYQPVFGQKAGWLMNRHEDGTFTIEFRTVKAGQNMHKQTEKGNWKYHDGRYTTITTSVAGVNIEPYYVDEYEIKSLTENEMTYYHDKAKQTFSSRRVNCDHEGS